MPALHWAAAKGAVAVVRTLLELGATLEQRDNAGGTALHWAAHKGHTDVLDALADAGSDLEKEDKVCAYAHARSVTPTPLVHHSVLFFLVHLFQSDSDMCVFPFALALALAILICQMGFTPLHHAARYGHEGFVRNLVDKGADPDPRTKSKKTPLAWAKETRAHKVVSLLLEKGAAPA